MWVIKLTKRRKREEKKRTERKEKKTFLVFRIKKIVSFYWSFNVKLEIGTEWNSTTVLPELRQDERQKSLASRSIDCLYAFRLKSLNNEIRLGKSSIKSWTSFSIEKKLVFLFIEALKKRTKKSDLFTGKLKSNTFSSRYCCSRCRCSAMNSSVGSVRWRSLTN